MPFTSIIGSCATYLRWWSWYFLLAWDCMSTLFHVCPHHTDNMKEIYSHERSSISSIFGSQGSYWWHHEKADKERKWILVKKLMFVNTQFVFYFHYNSTTLCNSTPTGALSLFDWGTPQQVYLNSVMIQLSSRKLQMIVFVIFFSTAVYSQSPSELANLCICWA
jgi:hypothetical protein